jgi:hypothetical protein
MGASAPLRPCCWVCHDVVGAHCACNIFSLLPVSLVEVTTVRYFGSRLLGRCRECNCDERASGRVQSCRAIPAGGRAERRRGFQPSPSARAIKKQQTTTIDCLWQRPTTTTMDDDADDPVADVGKATTTMTTTMMMEDVVVAAVETPPQRNNGSNTDDMIADEEAHNTITLPAAAAPPRLVIQKMVSFWLGSKNNVLH